MTANEKMVAEAERLMGLRQFGRARRRIRGALVISPGDEAALRLHFRALFAERLMERAVDAGERLALLTPSDAALPFAIMRCHFAAGAFEAAAAAGRRGMALADRAGAANAVALFDYARVLRRAGALEEAERLFAAAERLDGSLSRLRRIVSLTATPDVFASD